MAFVDPWQGVASGQQLVNGLFQQQDNMRAGRALAGGNYADAMSALGAGGNVQGVRQLQGDQIAMQDRQTAQADKAKAEQLATTLQVVRTLRSARDQNQDIGAQLQQYRGAFEAMGTPPEQYDQIAQQIASNPAILDQFEDVIGAEVRKLNFQKAGDSLLVFEEGNPDPVNRFEAPRRAVVSGGVSFDPVTGQPIADARRPEYIEVEGANGQPQIVAVGPNGASVAFEGQSRGPAVSTISPEEVASLGLQPGVYQRDRDGKINAVSGQGGDRLSAGQQKQVEGYYQEIAGLDNIDAELGRFAGMIEAGSLNLSPVSNAIGGVRNAIGASDENSRNLAEFRSTLERVRNDSLRLNSGVQTEGDAQRAWKELLDNINDPRLVQQQLRRIQGINARARQFRQQRINTLEGGSRQPPAASGGAQPRVRFNLTDAQQRAWQATPQTGSRGQRTNPIVINPESAAQSFNNVPSGGYFITPDGQLRGPKP